MAFATVVTVNTSNSLYPTLPIDRTFILVRSQRRMLNGQLRAVHRAAKARIVLTLQEADGTEQSAWRSAFNLGSTANTVVDELGTSRSMLVTDYEESLVRTVPGTPGDGYWDIRVTLEEV